MRRWNGWGDQSVTKPLADSIKKYLTKKIGELTPYTSVSLKTVLDGIPDSNLPVKNQVNIDSRDRLLHARGQSFPDWIALRTGRISTFPDGVVHPASITDIQNIIAYAYGNSIRLIPYGGGTSVAGHINPEPDEFPNITIDMSRMNRLTDLKKTDMLATFEAGIRGPDLEKQLYTQGYTLGHFPQSFELSTLGGWIATRSCGQQSLYYGRMKELFAGGHVETAQGSLDLPAFPASAAGPDLREMILGSEGRLGIITHAVTHIHPLPEAEKFYGVIFKDWESGILAVREIAQKRLNVSMVRLSDPPETEANLILSGKEKVISLFNRVSPVLGYGANRCLLIYGVSGDVKTVFQTGRKAKSILRSQGGSFTIESIGKTWQKNRFLFPYLRNTLWDAGVGIDTMETAVPWSKVQSATTAIKTAISQAMEKFDERILVFSHLSHIYPDGASIYITCVFRLTADPDELFERWKNIKAAGSQAVIDQGGTISHQHGIGTDHAQYLKAEKGSLGMEMITAVHNSLDPKNLFNPGKLIL